MKSKESQQKGSNEKRLILYTQTSVFYEQAKNSQG